MNNVLTPSRVRSLQESSIHHQKISTLFMRKTLSPVANLTTSISRLATDGIFNHPNGRTPLVR